MSPFLAWLAIVPDLKLEKARVRWEAEKLSQVGQNEG